MKTDDGNFHQKHVKFEFLVYDRIQNYLKINSNDFHILSSQICDISKSMLLMGMLLSVILNLKITDVRKARRYLLRTEKGALSDTEIS